MTEYIATFYTHLAALKSARALKNAGVAAFLMPVPRKVSASCGTCVRFEAETPRLDLLDADMEAVYLISGNESYTLVHRSEEKKA